METIKKTLKDSAALRWLVLILISGLTFGTYWFQDFFSGIKTLMITEMGITSSQFGTIIQWTYLGKCIRNDYNRRDHS